MPGDAKDPHDSIHKKRNTRHVARILEQRRERILTIMMSPFMSCGARLAIYGLFVTSFFKSHGQNIIFALYLIGIGFALLTAWILRSTVLRGSYSTMILELPSYQLPSIKILLRTTKHRLKNFLVKAGIIIVPLCVIFSGLSAFKAGNDELWLTYLGKKLTPIFSPMGIEEDNWPATLGLLTGVIAKEVVVGTLNSLYSNEANLLEKSSEIDGSGSHFSKENLMSHSLAQHFKSDSQVFAYLLFVLLYFPCVSVLAVICRELNVAWAVFSATWTTSVAYSAAVLFYQSSILIKDPSFKHWAFYWVIGLITCIGIGIYLLKKWIHVKDMPMRKPVPTRLLVLKQ